MNKQKGYENLIIPTSEQARINGRKGGIASQKKRKELKSLKECAKIFATLPIDDNIEDQLKRLGLENNETNYQMAMIVSLAQKAMKGDISALRTYMELLGDDRQISVQEGRLSLSQQEFKEQLKLKEKELELREKELQYRMERGDYSENVPIVIGGEDELED